MLSGIGNSTPVPNVVSMLVKAVEERGADIKEDIAKAKREQREAAEAQRQSIDASKSATTEAPKSEANSEASNTHEQNSGSPPPGENGANVDIHV